MPASDFGWPQNQHAQVFQVFSNKRKHDWSEYDDMDMQLDGGAKRFCHQPTNCSDAMNEQLEINHNSIQPSLNPNSVQPSGNPNSIPPSAANDQNGRHFDYLNAAEQLRCHILQQQQPPQETDQNQINQPTSPEPNQTMQSLPPPPQPVPTQTENHMVMDMCDETYSNACLDPETQAMYSQMDSDCAPNLQQYGGGDRSPTSGRVRCFCKPSWEGMLELRPYVSDYY